MFTEQANKIFQEVIEKYHVINTVDQRNTLRNESASMHFACVCFFNLRQVRTKRTLTTTRYLCLYPLSIHGSRQYESFHRGLPIAQNPRPGETHL